ncbi:MAG: hypothetical protein NT066_05990 [Candidatus Omnitrophica bacterium]|nr:hypothetical protein [Candidatus Omnitrophota bacterium]
MQKTALAKLSTVLRWKWYNRNKGGAYVKKYILLLLAVIFIPAEVLSYVTYISPEKLADESDLIIIGTVKEIQKSDEKIINSWGMRRGNVVQIYPVKYANVSIEEVLKGKPVSSVIVKFVFIKRKELDCQEWCSQIVS